MLQYKTNNTRLFWTVTLLYSPNHSSFKIYTFQEQPYCEEGRIFPYYECALLSFTNTTCFLFTQRLACQTFVVCFKPDVRGGENDNNNNFWPWTIIVQLHCFYKLYNGTSYTQYNVFVAWHLSLNNRFTRSIMLFLLMKYNSFIHC